MSAENVVTTPRFQIEILFNGGLVKKEGEQHSALVKDHKSNSKIIKIVIIYYKVAKKTF